MDRKTGIRVLMSAIFLLVAAVPVTAQQPQENIVATDGDYTAFYNGVVRDARTGLEWYTEPNMLVIWKNARTWAKELGIDGGGWRLPTEAELRDLRQPANRPNYITSLIPLYANRSYVWMDGRGKKIESGYWGSAFSFITAGTVGKYRATDQIIAFRAQTLVVRESK